jgi:hypothetical protein
MKLSYLFECHLNDGTLIQQTPEDVSVLDPTRSAYYDVVQRKADVEVFGIFNDDHTYAVDLRDGHFEIDGVPFNVLSGDPVLAVDQKLELVYFRRHIQTMVLGAVEMIEEAPTEFFIGWKTTIKTPNKEGEDGEEEEVITRTISIK